MAGERFKIFRGGDAATNLVEWANVVWFTHVGGVLCDRKR